MSDTHDERGPFRGGLRAQLVAAGTEAAEQWLAVRANRKMSDVNRRRLAGHVVNALWTEIETAVLEMAEYVAGEQLAAANAATARAESATVLPGRWRALIAERDAAVKRAKEAEVRLTDLGKPTEWGQPRTEWTWSARKPDGAAVPPMFPDPHPPRTEESVRREFNGVVDNMGYRKVLLCRDVTAWRDANAMHGTNVDDGSGWTAEENAEFEQRYGVQAARRLRAANDRVWQVVQELRQAAVDEGRDPYQDPMARRLSAALVGAEKVCSALPESLSGPQICCTRHVHNGLMHICALAAGHDTHMCAEGDRWTTNDDATEDDRG